MPLRTPSMIWLVAGLIVAFVQDYFDSLGTISQILTAILAVLLWPLVLIGFDIRVSR
jgi:uncharacterized membrane protein